MVFQDERSIPWFWPLGSCSFQGKTQGMAPCSWEAWGAQETHVEPDARRPDPATSEDIVPVEQVFDTASNSSSSSGGFGRFHVVVSTDKLQYQLVSDSTGELVFSARVALESRTVEILTPGMPSELSSQPRPAFTMRFSRDKAEWRIIKGRCGCCQRARTPQFCNYCRQRRVALIRHSRTLLGDAIAHCMDVYVPCSAAGGESAGWRPLEEQLLVTRKPSWDEALQQLSLTFDDRDVQPSAANFQLVRSGSRRTVCQYGKISQSTYGLDFKPLMSDIQAFGAAISTMFWT